ncbi:MAG: dipeptidase [Anaerolineales bacterium]|nr:dipeptidase [Anaerolineales bacterium]
MFDQRIAALEYVRQNKEQSLKLLETFLSIPSISTEPANQPDMQRAAYWVAAQLSGLGMQNVEIFPTARHPVVYAEWLGAHPRTAGAGGAPTVLIYGHYDVQPADPLDRWQTGPFEPTVRGESLYARGASDMKGQVVAVMKAVEAIVKSGDLPVNLKWLIEGEEEIGSPSLEAFIAEHKNLLACDFALNPDAGMIGPEDPTITYALRGLAYFELRVFGPASDLHSGIYGGVVHNPANALAELIAGMHDAEGRVTLPGFYDKVRPLSKEERAELARLPTDEKHFLEQTGAPALYGEAGFTPAERAGARPTLDVNGMLSGFTGAGSKTVIPAWAMAKISMRLVPDQDPADVAKQFYAYLEARASKDIRWEVTEMHGGTPSISDRNNAGVRAMAATLESVWGKQPYFRREGGSIPVVAQMQRVLGIESVVAGFGLPNDNVHAPNERLHLPTWYMGIEAFIHFFINLGS